MQKNKKIYSYYVYYEAVPEGGYVAFAPALPGCHTQGETLEEAENNIKEAIEVYLESVLKRQNKLPRETRSFQGMVQIPIPSSI